MKVGIHFDRAETHLRKARKHFAKVKDKDLAEGLRRLCTGMLRMNGEFHNLGRKIKK